MFSKNLFSLLLFCCIQTICLGQEDELIKILKEEQEREFEILTKEPTPVYFISYRVTDLTAYYLEASFGSLMRTSKERVRLLNPSVRVGSYDYDNTHNSKNNFNYGGNNAIPLPLNNDPGSIRQSAWLATDLNYKMASAAYSLAQQSEDEKEKTSADFTREPVVNYIETLPDSGKVTPEVNVWIEKLKSWSALFLEGDDFIDGDIMMRFTYGPKYFISSEGSVIRQNEQRAEIQINASTRSKDGNVIPLHRSFFALTPEELPGGDLVKEEIREMINTLEKMKSAKNAEPYSGPAIFSGSAAGVFFHEIFGHRVEADRLKKEEDSQTFKEKLGKKVLPKFLNVTFDPAATEFNGMLLTGSYKYDDEGVAARRVELVENGVLRDFLRSRRQLSEGQQSNGHSRAQGAMDPVTRQSNMIVTSEKTYSDEKLRKLLIKECKKQGKPFGYFIKRVAGGYTMTDRYQPNAFSITPTEVYKVFVDGRPNELVRGIDLIGTPLTMFSEIKATGETHEIFYGYCGAESGYVPVTAIAPPLFVRKIETQKKPESSLKKPILPQPSASKE